MRAAEVEHQRGQVLPLWTFGALAMFVLMFFVLSYGNTVRWQIRAQNAADAAAQSIVALQTQQFNQMEIILYASAVEEFRIRRLLHATLLAAHSQGGCGDDATCEQAYLTLRPELLKATQRYTNDVLVTNRITANLSYDATRADAAALLARLGDAGSCAAGTGGDCAFRYVLLNFSPRTEDLETVKMDALGILKPSFSQRTAAASINSQLFAPVQVEVSVCAQIPPIVPGFFNFAPQPFLAIGRAAATAVMVEHDWLQPGQVVNAVNGGVFQPSEQYVSPFSQSYDWYGVDFGGNSTQAFESYNVFSAALVSDEFSVRLGWWNSIPIPAYTGSRTAGELGCG
jgi:Flp pilus assembly protein TadG